MNYTVTVTDDSALDLTNLQEGSQPDPSIFLFNAPLRLISWYSNEQLYVDIPFFYHVKAQAYIGSKIISLLL